METCFALRGSKRGTRAGAMLHRRRGEIPGQPEGGTITYFMTALDSADNLGAGKDQSFTVGSVLSDLNGDGSVGAVDLLILLANWGPCGDCKDCPADLHDDCTVGVSDLLILLANWG